MRTRPQFSSSRRRFVRSLAAAGVTLPVLPGLSIGTTDTAVGTRHLVLVELRGGNDGLNTVVPYTDPLYAARRPTLALPTDSVLALDERVGLHPALSPIMRLWDRNEMAIVQGMGYPEPNRSHFRSIEIWETASDADEALLDGWLAPVADRLTSTDPDGVRAVAFADDDGPLAGTTGRSIVVDNLERFLQQGRRLRERETITDNPVLAHILEVERTARRGALDFTERLRASGLEDQSESRSAALPDTSGASEMGSAAPRKEGASRFVKEMDAIGRLIAEDVGPRVWKVGLGTFDTHASQLGRQASLLEQLARGIATFERVLRDTGRWNDVVLVTYSEFGRRTEENVSNGTDHGTAAPHFVIGGAVKGGLVGRHPDLANLEGGDLVHDIDFRSLYRTIASDWFGQPDAGTPYAGFRRLKLFS